MTTPNPPDPSVALKWQKLIERYVLRHVKTREHPWFEDLVQDGFEGFLLALQTYDPTRAAVATYCMRAVKWNIQKRLTTYVTLKGFQTRERRDGVWGEGRWEKQPVVGSLNDSLLGDPGATIGDILTDENARAPDDDFRLMWLQASEALEQAIGAQGRPDLARDAVVALIRDETLDEVGTRHGVSRERVRQVRVMVLDAAREALA